MLEKSKMLTAKLCRYKYGKILVHIKCISSNIKDPSPALAAAPRPAPAPAPAPAIPGKFKITMPGAMWSCVALAFGIVSGPSALPALWNEMWLQTWSGLGAGAGAGKRGIGVWVLCLAASLMQCNGNHLPRFEMAASAWACEWAWSSQPRVITIKMGQFILSVACWRIREHVALDPFSLLLYLLLLLLPAWRMLRENIFIVLRAPVPRVAHSLALVVGLKSLLVVSCVCGQRGRVERETA